MPSAFDRKTPYIFDQNRHFANRYLRDARRLEALHAGRLSPGATTWQGAFMGLRTEIKARKSPIRTAQIIKKAAAYLDSVNGHEAMHVEIWNCGATRSASLMFLSISAGSHPLDPNEEGIILTAYGMAVRRTGDAQLIGGVQVAFISKHALVRLHERDLDLRKSQATGIFKFIGALGYLTRHCPKHAAGDLCLLTGDTLAVGRLKPGVQTSVRGGPIGNTFYDVRTVLSTEWPLHPDMTRQGRIAAEAAAAWFSVEDRSNAFEDALTDSIPFVPRRDEDSDEPRKEQTLCQATL